MRRTFSLALVLLLFLVTVSIAQANRKTGSFILFYGGNEAGQEDFWLNDTELRTEGTISVGGQTLTVNTTLSGQNREWSRYDASLMPGAMFGAQLKNDEVQVEVGPIKRSFAVESPYVVLDNNVFAHYEQIVAQMHSGPKEQTFNVVVPSLVLANQDPVLTAHVVHVGEVEYRTEDGQNLSLQEYIFTLSATLQMRLLALGEQLISLEIPMQAVEVYREGYVGMTKQELAQEPSHLLKEDFTVTNGDVTLAGTLALPLGEGPFPAILLNSGSGPQDRHGNTPPVFMTNMFDIFAEKLTEMGIAVLSYDERGVGESTGDYDAATVEDLVSDIGVLIDFLAEHPQINGDRLAMLGHSEGAYFAPLFAERLSAIVLLAGASIPLDQIMVEQLDYQLSKPWLSSQEKAVLEQYRPLMPRIIEEAKAGKDESEVLPMNLEWLRQHMELRPLENVAKVTSPVLIVHGEEDLKVMPYHANQLAEALKEAGNSRVTVHTLPLTTHEFTFFPIGNDLFDALEPHRLNPALFEVVVPWLKENL